MGRWLNIGIIAACLGIFVSLSDFVFTPKQKKSIENFIDTITLLLDYTKTLHWLQSWLKASRRASIVTVFFTIISVVMAVANLTAVEWPLWKDTSWWKLIAFGVVAFYIWWWQWRYVIEAYKSVGIPIVDWLAESESYVSLIFRYVSVIVGGLLVLGICISVLVLVFFWAQRWWAPALALAIVALALVANFVFGMILCWIGLVIDGIVTLVGAFILFVLKTIIDAARWTMWRISTYPKGPLTATLTLVGAVLATLKLFLSK